MHVRRNALVRLLGAIASASVVVSAALPAAAQSVQDDPSNVIYAVDIDKEGGLGKLSTAKIPARGFYTSPVDATPKKDLVQPKDPSRLQPELEQLLSTGDPVSIVGVLIALREDTTIPRLPDLPVGETRDSAVAKDLSRQQDQIVDGLRQARQKSQAALIARLQEQYKLELKEQFWLVNGFLAELPLGAVKDLLQYDEIQYIQLQNAGEKPPADANPNNDVSDGRGRIVSDPYFNLPNMSGGFVGLLDTGVRTTHTTFAAPGDHIDFLRDCVNGGTSCNNTAAAGFNTDDNCWNHGTSTASIFTGNGNQGADFRGITAITLDSWKVYGCAGLDSAATVRGFQAGLLAFDRVFIGELQASETENGTIATAADNAFDAGAVVISANGNFGPGASTVRSPAIAHKVIGVGGYNVETLTTLGSQGRGPATDGRFKPDIQTPSLTETASTASATAQQVFTGTSGATPYAAGAAALTRNFMKQFGLIEPGHVYARLIQSGQHVWPYDNEEGAGDLKMPTCGTAFWGKVNVNSSGSTIDIPLAVGAGRTGIETALWWPERVGESHDDVDVHLIDPSGIERARGFSAMSIFERARVSGALASGTWTIRIKGFSIASGIQPVFWSTSLRGC
ncbi:MAG TPA: S8 family serine peptidase [Chloroflexota bacterium]